MSVLKVAAAQMPCASGLTDESIARHLEAIEDSRAQGVDVLVFPELSLTGYAAAPDLLAQARPARAPELALLAAAAGPMLVAVGFIEEGPAAQFYAAQALPRAAGAPARADSARWHNRSATARETAGHRRL